MAIEERASKIGSSHYGHHIQDSVYNANINFTPTTTTTVNNNNIHQPTNQSSPVPQNSTCGISKRKKYIYFLLISVVVASVFVVVFKLSITPSNSINHTEAITFRPKPTTRSRPNCGIHGGDINIIAGNVIYNECEITGDDINMEAPIIWNGDQTTG